jgi:hypothetical protein
VYAPHEIAFGNGVTLYAGGGVAVERVVNVLKFELGQLKSCPTDKLYTVFVGAKTKVPPIVINIAASEFCGGVQSTSRI